MAPPKIEKNQIVELISQARDDREAMGRLLEVVRPYLLSISNEELSPELRVKIAASDVVQETVLEAVRDFQQFEGSSAGEFAKWIRTVLRNNLANQARRYSGTINRSLEREVALDGLDRDGLPVFEPAAAGPSPLELARTNEAMQTVRQAMSQLPAHYQQVLDLRYWQQLKFAEIGKVMNRTPDATRMLWMRALEQLEQILGGERERTLP